MATVDETLELARSNRTRVGSIHALLDGIKQQLADVLAGVTLPPGVQQKVDAIFDELKAEGTEIDTVLNTGVPAPTPGAP